MLSSTTYAPTKQQQPSPQQLLSLASNNYMPAPLHHHLPRGGLTRFVSTHTRAILRSAPDRTLSSSADPRQAVAFTSHPPPEAPAAARLQLPPLPPLPREQRAHSSSPSPRTAAAEAGAKRVRKLIEAFESKPSYKDTGDSTIASRAELTRTPPASKTTFGGSHFRDDLKPVLSLDLSEKGKLATRYVQLMFDDSAALEVLARTAQGETMVFRTATAATRFRIIIEPINDPISSSHEEEEEEDTHFSARRRRADEHLTSAAHVSVEPTPAPSYINTPHSTRRRHRASSLDMPARVDELLPLDSHSPPNTSRDRRDSGIYSEGKVLEKLQERRESLLSTSSSGEEERGMEAYVLENLVRKTVLKCEQRELSLLPPAIPSEPPWGGQLNSGRVARLASVSEASSDGRLYTPSPRPPLGELMMQQQQQVLLRNRGVDVAWKEFCAEDEDFGFLVQPRCTDPERPEWPSHFVLHYWRRPGVMDAAAAAGRSRWGESCSSGPDRKMVLGVVSQYGGGGGGEPQYPCYCGCLEGKRSCTDGEMDLLVTKTAVRRTVSARMSDGCSQFSTDSDEDRDVPMAATQYFPQQRPTADDDEALSSLLFGANYLMSGTAVYNRGAWSPAAGSMGSGNNSVDDDDQRSKTTTGAKMTRARKRREQRKRRRQRLRDEELAMLMKSTALDSSSSPPAAYHPPSSSPLSSSAGAAALQHRRPPPGQQQTAFEVGCTSPLTDLQHHQLLDHHPINNHQSNSRRSGPTDLAAGSTTRFSPHYDIMGTSGGGGSSNLNDLLREVTAFMINQTVTTFD